MADERNPAAGTPGPDPDATAADTPPAADATQPVPAGDATQAMPGSDATRAIPAGDTTAATQPVIAPRWAARASVPPDAPDDLNYPALGAEEYPATAEPTPVSEEERSGLSPAVIALIVLVLLAILGTGLWLIFRNSSSTPAPVPSGPTATAPATTAAPTESPTPAPTPSATTATTTPPAPTTAVPAPPPPTPTQPPSTVTVPRLVGLPEAQAKQRLTDLGLTFQVEYQQADRKKTGTVLSSNPAEGARVPKGTLVTLIVAAAPASTPPSPGAAPGPAT